MIDVLYLAGRYLASHAPKTIILIASLTLVIYTPFGLRTIVRTSQQQLRERAESTPLLIGSAGSPLELTLNSLYFRSETPPSLGYGEAAKVRNSGLADALPLHVRFRTGDWPIVGTSFDYFEFRGLETAEGRPFIRLGECVLGATAARELGKVPGDPVMSSPESVFDLAGVYPLKMRVAGVLAPSGLPDDRAVFVDVKTAWVIQGLAHGHDDLADPSAAGGVLRREGDRIIANRSVVEYNEITADNRDEFHFHGDPASFPITGLIAVPRDEKSTALLMGRYQGEGKTLQIFRPAGVMDELFATVFRVEGFVVAAFAGVGVATLATAVLVFLLSLRLRRREFLTLRRIGAEPLRVTVLWSSEIVSVLAIAALLTFVLNQATGWAASEAVEWLLDRS
jgi:putative ABC transport system permease protein